MRILIDLQGAQNGSRHRGIGRYSLALANAIARNRGGHEIFIFLNGLFPETIDEIRESFLGLLPNHHFIIFNATGPVDELPVENTWRVRSAELLREKLINDLSPDIVLISSLIEGACDNTVTSIGQLFSRVPTAVVLYDLIPFLDPEKYIGWGPAKNWYYRKIDALKRADLLLAISKSAQNEAIDHLGVHHQRTVNISSAADSSFKKLNLTATEVSKVFSCYGIKRKFLMHSSAFDERKNFEGLIKAFALLPKKLRANFQLVLVCKIDDAGRDTLNSLASMVGLEKDELVLTGFVSDANLIALYSECYLFVFPSFHEGFGLPALEAMCCGAPAIGSNTSSIPEVIGRTDALFDPKSTESIARLIEKVLTDSDFWQSLKDHAITQSKKFNWNECAIAAIKGFEELHKNKSSSPEKDSQNDFDEFIENIASIKSNFEPSEQDLIDTANSINKNETSARQLRSFSDFGGVLKWRIEGPFDSTYSLALLNRETARALDELGHFVVLHSTEGPGDFPANPEFLISNPDISMMHARITDYPQSAVDVTSRNLYPPRVSDMQSPLNLLHHYAWEESGFPQDWVNNFNANLNGITCLSNHVEKILIDNGVSVPMLTSGCGVDHWERISATKDYQIKAKKFRFLHVSSCFPRKGVDLLLDAYGLAFTSKDDVTLIIKTFENPHNEIHQWIAERKSKNSQFPDVLVIEGDLSDSQLKALYQECHVLVAPSKAEGFGLPMAEAMLSGLPVITTAWGGQLDFCNEDNSWLVDYEFERAKTHFGLFISVWAKINVEKLASTLIQARNSTQEHLTEKAFIGRKQLLENFKWVDVVGRAVDAENKWKAQKNIQPNVKIGWITTWNTKCGIATYSEHLISNMEHENITILAPNIESTASTHSDGENCIRCWTQGKDANEFNNIENNIVEKSLNTIIIQFNYGFYNFFELSDFIEKQLNSGRIIIIMMHSTSDPFGETANWQLSELRSIFARCHRILVHSIPDLNRLKLMGLIENVTLFPHGVLNYPKFDSTKEKDNSFLIASYGFCLPHKGLTELVQAIEILKTQGQSVRLRMVNAEYPDKSSSQLINELKDLIKKLEIDELVELHTDFLPDQESLSLLSDANLLVFAYQETGESASGAVRYGLATKRPIAVTPLKIFDDIGSAAFRFSGTSATDIATGISEIKHELSILSERAQYIHNEAEKWRAQHDYAAVSNRLLALCSALVRKHPQRTHRFHGSSPLIKTVVGALQGKSIVTTRTAGNLIHGPYLALAAGYYKVILHGTTGLDNLSEVRVDVVVDNGRLTIGESALSGPDNGGCLAMLPIALHTACTDLEVRVWVNNDTDLQISMIEIAPCDFDGIHRFSGSDNRFGTKTGLRTGQDIVTTGKAGYLFFGPYIPLASGQYHVIITGALGGNGLSGAHMDVAVNKGQSVLARSALGEPNEDGCLISLPLTLHKPCTDFEVRLWVDENTDLKVSTIRIEPWHAEPEAGAAPSDSSIILACSDKNTSVYPAIDVRTEKLEALDNLTASQIQSVALITRGQIVSASNGQNQAKAKRKKKH